MAAKLPTRADVVGFLVSAGRPLHAGEIGNEFGLRPASRQKFNDLLEQLADDGAVVRLGGQRFRAAREVPARDAWDGALQMNPRGFGFVSAAGRDDVFVPAEAIAGAVHGDTVRVEVMARTHRGVEGRVAEVVKRRNPRIAGTLYIRKKSAWLEPDDSRMRGPIVIHSGHEHGDDGLAAIAEITRFPVEINENPEGKIISVLGEPGEIKVEVKKILIREQIEEVHSAEAEREAEQVSRSLIPAHAPDRADLRHIPFLTIDPEDARDHDDAIWAERRGAGFRAYIAIADVSEYVTPGTALDEEARQRSFTLYLPDRAVPMLPPALAANACSLLPGVERLCLAAIVDLDASGSVQDVKLVEGVMRAAAYITYGSAARALGFTDKPPQDPEAESRKAELEVIDQVARKLRARRMQRGALDLDLPEAKLELDPEGGELTWIGKRAQDPGVKQAYQLVEEFMLLANECVARWLSAKNCPAIYRVHSAPDEEKLDRLGEICQQLGVVFPREDLADAAGLGAFLKEVKTQPKSFVIESLLLRSLKQAVYDINNIGHFGLASAAYLHFTSPIRRYPDLLVHRAVKQILRGVPIDASPAAIESLRDAATHASTRERSIMQIEREVVDLYRALFMRDHIGEQFEGTVGALVGSGLFLNLGDPFVDVLVRFEDLGPEQYELDDSELMVVGSRSGDRVMLGDRMKVEIIDVAVLRRTTYGRRVISEEELARHKEYDKQRRTMADARSSRRRIEQPFAGSSAGGSSAGRSSAGGSSAGRSSAGRSSADRSSADRSSADRSSGARRSGNAGGGKANSGSSSGGRTSGGRSSSGKTSGRTSSGSAATGVRAASSRTSSGTTKKKASGARAGLPMSLPVSKISLGRPKTASAKGKASAPARGGSASSKKSQAGGKGRKRR